MTVRLLLSKNQARTSHVLSSLQGNSFNLVLGTQSRHTSASSVSPSSLRSFSASSPRAFTTALDKPLWNRNNDHFPTVLNPYRFNYRNKSTSIQAPRNFDPANNSTGTIAGGSELQDEETEGITKTPKPYILDLGIKSLIPEWRKMFDRETLFTDITTGVTVGCIAVPLSLAIALASGVPAEVGLVTAAVSGVAGGLMGGTTLAVTGPAAAISLLCANAVQQHGLETLPIIVMTAGGLQLVSGVTRLGAMAKLVPVSVIAGFTTGVGTLILTGQLPKAFGMSVPAGMNPIELVSYIGSHVEMISPTAAALAVGTSAAMFALPKLHPKIPSALVAVGGATLATHTLGLDVALIGSIPTGAFQMGLPTLPPLEALPSLAATTGLIFGMTSAETLLSCVALEKMKKTTYKHNPDQELIGQGIASIGSALFMGMPVTSVIARSSLNVKLGASTRLPALVQAGFVFSSVMFLGQSIAMIPLSALSGVLITTGMGMLNPAELKHCYAVQKKDVLPFAVTFGSMVTLGLAEGIGMGCISACMLHYSNSNLQANLVDNVWHLKGPINFFNMLSMEDLVKRMESESIVLDMQGVTAVEFTGVEELVMRLNELDAAEVEMLNCGEDVLRALDQCDPSRQIKRSPSHM